MTTQKKATEMTDEEIAELGKKMEAEAQANLIRHRAQVSEEAVAHLRAIEEIRRRVELAPDQLALVDAVYRRIDAAPGRRPPVAERPEAPARIPLSITSHDGKWPRGAVKIKPGQVARVVARPLVCAFRIEEIEIVSSPMHWIVRDVRVGNRTQAANHLDGMPGRMFVPGGTCYRFVTETIQTAMEFEMLVEYVGPEPDGEVFEAIAMGLAAI